MAFDPDAFLAQPAAPAFDPDAFLRSTAPAKPPPPSTLTALGRGAAQGATLGLGERLMGAIQAALPVPGDAATYGERYAKELKSAQTANDNAKEAHPWAYGIGNAVGGAAPTVLMPSLKAAQGASLATRAGTAALNAAPVGAAVAVGESRDPTVAGQAKDMLAGGLVGGAIGGAMPGLGDTFRDAMAGMSESQAAKSLLRAQQAMTGTSTIARKKPPSPEAVEQAFKSGAIRFGSNVEGIANRLQDAADPLAKRYGEILTELEAKGVTGPNASQLAMQMLNEGQQAWNNSIIGTRAGALRDAATALTGSPGGHMTPAVPPKPTLGASPGGDLGLMQSELMKRELQADAASQYVKEGATSLAGAAKKEIAGTFRQAIEDAVQAQAWKAPEEAAAFQPVKEELHRTLEGLGFAREGAARYARRNPFGLHEAMGLASGIASGNPLEAVGSVGIMHALKDRGASSSAVIRRGLSQGALALSGVEANGAPVGATVALSPKARALVEALRLNLTPATADEERK